MKFKIITIISIISAFTIAIIFGCNKKNSFNLQNEDKFIIHSMMGKVKISDTSGEIVATPGALLSSGDIIITGEKSIVDLIWGTNGVIRINENSHISIVSIDDYKNKDSILEMSNGKVNVILTKLKSNGFHIKTTTILASVRGTSFTVISGKQGAQLSVAKGVVTLNPLKEGNIIENKYVDVEAGSRTEFITEKIIESITAAEKKISVVEMDAYEKKELQGEMKDMKIEEIPELTAEIKNELIESTKIDNTIEKINIEKNTKKELAPKRKDNKIIKKLVDQKRIEEEEKAKKEAELKAPSSQILR